MAHSSRTWTGARSPQGKKRVRQAERRNEILQPRRSAAKTLVKSALVAAGTGGAEQTQAAVILAVSALDRAAKVGAIHPNAAARRKSRLMLKVNATLGGEQTVTTAKVARQTSKAQATKAAKARIAAGKATKAKGEQTAAGKARAALSKTSREAAAAVKPVEAPKAATKGKAATTKAATTKAAAKAKATAKATTAEKPATTKAAATKAAPKAKATSTTKAPAAKAAPKAKAPKGEA
ncbi:MAG: 30S ribosomal protein S20 [Chloroflexi bacterium]|nr:30S ribosomal protein S20 [Chloroflexota bacterium]